MVFRGRDNKKVGVLDALCIHLGANLAIGGKVVNDCIQVRIYLTNCYLLTCQYPIA